MSSTQLDLGVFLCTAVSASACLGAQPRPGFALRKFQSQFWGHVSLAVLPLLPVLLTNTVLPFPYDTLTTVYD